MSSSSSTPPMYCGVHEKSFLVRNTCPKCGRKAQEFMEPSYQAPIRIVGLAIVLFLIGILLVPFSVYLMFTGSGTTISQLATLAAAIGAIIGGIAALGNVFFIRKRGLVYCSGCKWGQSPKAVWCIYCGAYIKWWIPPKAKEVKTGAPIKTQDRLCTTCGLPVSYIPDYDRYYCEHCQDYQQETKKNPPTPPFLHESTKLNLNEN